MRRLIIAAPVLSTALALTAQAEPVERLSTENGRFEAAFEVYVGGFAVAELEAASEIGEERYRQSILARTAGMLAWFVEGESESVATGRIDADGRVQAERFENQGVWNDEARTSIVTFDADGAVTGVETVPPQKDEREPVPDGLRRGPDPLSLVVEAALSPVNGPVERTVNTYDGKRAVEFSWSCDGRTESMIGSGSAVYAGPVMRCAVDGQQVGGFHKEYGDRALDPPKPAELWLAPVDDGRFFAPVRLTMQTRFGGMVARLTRVGPPEPAATD